MITPHDRVGNRVFLEGNTAAALGCVYGGATVAAWYPITPSSSCAEAFQKYCMKLRVDPNTGQNKFAIVQAEDEIASIGMVVGAGWNGARAFTTIGRLKPGVSAQQATAAIAPLIDAGAKLFPQFTGPVKARVRNLRDLQVGDASRTAWLVLGASGVFLLIVWVNASGLLLAQDKVPATTSV